MDAQNTNKATLYQSKIIFKHFLSKKFLVFLNDNNYF